MEQIEKDKLGVFQAYGLGWQSFKKNWVMLVGFVVLSMIINITIEEYGYTPAESHRVPTEVALQYKQGQITAEELAGEAFMSIFKNETETGAEMTKVAAPSQGSPAVSFIGFIVGLLLGVAGLIISIQAARGQEISYESVTRGLSVKNVLYYFVAGIIMAILIVIGLALLIVPGIILMLMFAMTYYLVIDQDKGPIEALSLSKQMTKGYRWQILGIILVSVLVIILGFVALVVGLLVAVPWVMQTMAVVYLYLNGELKEGSIQVVEEATE